MQLTTVTKRIKMFINNSNIHYFPVGIPRPNINISKYRNFYKSLYQILFYTPKIMKYFFILGIVFPTIIYIMSGIIVFVSRFPSVPTWTLIPCLLGLGISIPSVGVLLGYLIYNWDNILKYLKDKST